MRNWNETHGLEWVSENVKDKEKTLAGAQVPRIVPGGLQRFLETLTADGGDPETLLNGSEALAQIGRSTKRRHPELSGEALRDKVWRRLCGERTRGGGTVYIALLPNGDSYTGRDRTEFMAAYMAAAVEEGFTADSARRAAERAATKLNHLQG